MSLILQDLLLGIVFLLAYTAVLSNVLRLFFFWRAVRALLRRRRLARQGSGLLGGALNMLTIINDHSKIN